MVSDEAYYAPDDGTDEVLILVLMEYGLWHTYSSSQSDGSGS